MARALQDTQNTKTPRSGHYPMKTTIALGTPESPVVPTYSREEAQNEAGFYIDRDNPRRGMIVFEKCSSKRAAVYVSIETNHVAAICNSTFEDTTFVKATQPLTLTFAN